MNLQIGIPRDLDVKLSPEEVNQKAQILAKTMTEIASVEEDKAKAVRSFSVRLKDMKRRAQELARNVSKGEEMRPVLTSERVDLRRLQIETYRHDTGEVIDSQAMTQEQLEEARQGDLFHEQRPTRVHVDKPKGLDLDTPGAAPISTPEASNVVPIRAPAESSVSAVASDETEITDPEGLQNGKVAAKAAKKAAAAAKAGDVPKRTRRRGGMNIGSESGPEPKATPSERVGAATIVKPDEPAPASDDAPAGEPEPDVSEDDTDPAGDS